MATYGKEGIAVIQKLLKKVQQEGTLSKDKSKNLLKKMNRSLGSAMFSPDALGYLDIIDDGLSKNLSAEQILNKIRSKSEKLVEAYSFAPGIFEAHHVMPLNALRDNYMQLSPDEQLKFMQKLNDAGWQLGDSPQQLMYTLQTRMSHQGKTPELKKGDPTGTKALFKDAPIPDPSLVSHGAPDGIVRTNWPAMTAKKAGTADELMGEFGRIADVMQKQAILGNISEQGMRTAILNETGYDISKVTPEMSAALKGTDEAKNILQVGAANYSPQSTKQAAQTFENVTGQALDVYKASPDAVKQASLAMGLGGLGKGALGAIVGQTPLGKLVRGGVALSAFGADAAQAKEGIKEATTATNPLRQAAGQLETLGAAMGLGGFINPLTSLIPGLAAQHLRNRAQKQEEAKKEVQAIEGTRPAPVPEQTPEITKTKQRYTMAVGR